MKKVLLTGASGFIGSHMLKKLSDNNCSVIVPVRPGAVKKLESNNLNNSRYKLVKGNFYDDHILKILFEESFDAVFHFAAIRGSGKASWKEYQQVNVDGTEKLLKYAVKSHVKKFIFCSSVGVLGTIPDSLPASPNTTPNPDGYYHKSKYLAEKRILAIRSNEMRTLIIRPTITYGINDDGFITKMISYVKKGMFIIPGNPVKVHLLSVKALVELCANLLNIPIDSGQIYHIADKEPVYLVDLAKLFKKKIGSGRFYKLPAFLFNGATTPAPIWWGHALFIPARERLLIYR